MSEDVTLMVDGDEYPGRLDTPAEPTGRGILVVPGAGHGPFGDVFLRFGRAAADEGYQVARFETWMSPDDIESKTDEAFRADLQAGVEFLRDRGCSTVAVVAKSFGGRLALEHTPDGIDRLVPWAPAVIVEGTEGVPEEVTDALPTMSAAELRDVEVPIRVLQGDEDGIPLESAAALADAVPDGELVTLPGEDHSFLTDHERVIEETLAALN
ncbi:MAG: alpha/beta hydrolase [Haloglomus sp.]